MTSELFFVSLGALLLVLIILLVLCWILRHNKSRNLTELKISAGRPARVLTIRTGPDQLDQLLDRLLDRVFLQVEPEIEPEEELGDKPPAVPGEDLEGELRSHSGSNPELVAEASLPNRAAPATLFKDKDKL